MNIIIFVVYMMFPFLIGKVLTLLRHLDSQMRVVRFQFPFLIGKVLTTAFKPLW